MSAITRDERGRFARVETRTLRPEGSSLPPHEDVPNTTVPPASDPNTVGPPLQTGGEVGAIEVSGESGPPQPPSWLHASRWNGWPDSWFPPILWPRLSRLTDVAWSCLDLNSAVFAAMPPYLVDASPNLPTDWMVNPDPDEYSSWADFARALMWDFQLGEAFIVATARYANGWPARFHVAPAWTVEVDWDPARPGVRRYRIGTFVLPDEDMLHLRYQGTRDDLRGHGPLEVGASRMVAAETLNRYATNFALSGGVPPSVIEHPEELTAAQATDLRNQWIAARMEGMGVPAVLSGGVTWRPSTGVDPLSSALTELASYEEARIAVLLGVPPFLVGLPSGGDSMTYSNVSSIFDYHWRAGLKPKADRVTRALSQWLTPRGTTLEVNRDEYVRPGPLERAQTQAIYLDHEVLSVEEVRAMERFAATGEATQIGAFQ